MSFRSSSLRALCVMIVLVASAAAVQAEDYTGITAASYSAGPPKGISFKGSIMWGGTDPGINWVTAEILDENGNQFDDLGVIDHTFTGSLRQTKVESQIATVGPGKYRIRLHWFHNEGTEEKKQTDSLLVTVPGDASGGG